MPVSTPSADVAAEARGLASASPRGERPPSGRFARALGRVAGGAALVAVFGVSAVGALDLALDLPPTRRIVTRVTNRVLGSLFEGKIVIDSIDALSLSGVRVGSAAAIDPTGNETIRVVDLRARADVLGIAREALFGGRDERLRIPLVTIASADVEVEQRGGDLTLARTFTIPPEKPTATPAPAPSGPPAKVAVELSRIEIAHAFVHGQVAPPRALDGDVNRLVASLVAGNDGVVLDVQQTGLVERRLMPARTEATANYHLRVDAKGARMWAGLAGQIGGVEVLAEGELDGDVLRARADAPRVAPEVVTALVPGLVPTDVLSTHVELEGPIPHLSFAANAAAHGGASRVTADGKLDLAGPVRVDADVNAHDVDPHLFGEGLPRAALGGDARVRVELADLPRVSVDAHTDAATIEGRDVPAADVHVVLDRGVVTGRFTADETGMPVEGAFTFAPAEGVRFDARTEVAAIHAAPRIAGPVDGRARVHVAGVLKDEELDAHVDVSVAGLRLPGDVRVDHADVRGRVHGPLDGLSVDASATGAGMRAGGYAFDRVSASARGPVASLRVGARLETEDGGRVEATGVLDPRARGVRGVKVAIARDGAEVAGKVARIGAARGGIAVEGIDLGGDGAGALHGSLRVAGRDVTGKLQGDDVDLQQVGRLLGIPYRLKGVADVDVDIERDGAGRKGHVMLALEDGEGPLLSGVSAMVTTTFHGEDVEANALVRLVAKSSPSTPAEERCDGTIAQLRLTNGEGHLVGPLLDPATWQHLTGDAELAAEDWNLRCLARLVPVGLPFSSIRGTLTTKLSVSRPEGQRFASIHDLSIHTSRLEVIGLDAEGSDEPAWASRNVDAQIRGDLDGKTGRTQAELTLWDGTLLGDVSTTVDLDLATLVDHPERRLSSLRESALTGRLTIPRRSFDSLPALVQSVLPPLSGEARADAYVDGTVEHPFVTLRAFGFHVATARPKKAGGPAAGASPNPWFVPVDAEALVTYDSEHASLDARVTRRGNEVGTISAGIDANLGDIVSPKPGTKPAWNGGFVAKLKELPLGDVPFFAERGIAGLASGTVQMAGLGAQPTLSVDLSLPDLQVGPDLFFDDATVSLDVKHRPGAQRDTAVVKASLVGQGGGRLDASAYAGVRWKDGYLPVIDGDSPADFYARAQAFRAAAFLPFANGVFSKLDGYLDGDLRFGFRRLGDGDRGSVTAKMSLREGVLNLPQLGQELRHAKVDLVAEPDGSVRIDDIEAEGISGRIQGWAQARLDGLKFVDAGGHFVIPNGEEVPLTIEGVPFGEARGEISLTARKEGEALVMDVGVPSFHLALPTSSRRNAQSLDENPDIVVSHPLGPPKESGGDAGTKVVFNLDLGDVRLEGTGVDLTITSAKGAERPRVELSDKLTMTGEIDVVKGRFTVLGKDFQIEQGLVRMRPESPGNPFVNVTARWDAPDGSPIYVDYVGDLQPITAEKLKFRANGRSQAEVLAMLLGEESETDGTGTSTSTRAIGAGGAVVADQLNAMLQGVAPGFSTGIAQTEEGALKTSVAYQIGDKVTARASYQQQTERSIATQGAAYGVCISDRPGAACTELSVEWRLDRHFSVRGSVGGVGDSTNSSFDLLWKYRY